MNKFVQYGFFPHSEVVTKNKTRTGQLYSDMLTSCTRKQHRDNMSVVLCCLLAALGITLFNKAKTKSPASISRFLNHQNWSLRTLVRVMRQHTLTTLHDYLRGRRGRPPMIEIIVDMTSVAKEGVFADLDGWIHTWNGVRGLHIVMLYFCCGELRLPWGFKFWRGKGTPSPADLGLRLVEQLPDEIRSRAKNVHLLADAGFGTERFIMGVTALGYEFTVGMRANRLTEEDQHLNEITSQQRRVRLKGVPDLDLWVYWVWLPAKKGEDREQRFIVSSRERTPQIAKQTGKRRWKIEALFKTLKSRFAFEKFQQKSKLGVLRYLCLSLACFLLSHAEQLDQIDLGQEQTSWPDWGELAEQVRMKCCGWIMLDEIDLKRGRIAAVWNEAQGLAA